MRFTLQICSEIAELLRDNLVFCSFSRIRSVTSCFWGGFIVSLQKGKLEKLKRARTALVWSAARTACHVALPVQQKFLSNSIGFNFVLLQASQKVLCFFVLCLFVLGNNDLLAPCYFVASPQQSRNKLEVMPKSREMLHIGFGSQRRLFLCINAYSNASTKEEREK